jgi:hypothetical protein
MKSTSLALVVAFASGCLLTATAVSGCSKAADRTLTIFQMQSTNIYVGQFRIDTSELPPKAIESKTDSGGLGGPVTRIAINMDYEIEVVLRLAGNRNSKAPEGK